MNQENIAATMSDDLRLEGIQRSQTGFVTDVYLLFGRCCRTSKQK